MLSNAKNSLLNLYICIQYQLAAIETNEWKIKARCHILSFGYKKRGGEKNKNSGF